MNDFYNELCNINFRNGGTSNSPLQGKYCGGIDSIPNTIKSFSHQMYIKFVSDTTDSEKGFEIEWDLLTIGEYIFINSNTNYYHFYLKF